MFLWGNSLFERGLENVHRMRFHRSSIAGATMAASEVADVRLCVILLHLCHLGTISP